MIEGFAAESLASLPGHGPESLFGAFAADATPGPISIETPRDTLEPGGKLTIPYPFPGPVLFYVDQGALQLDEIGPNVRLVFRDSEGWTEQGPNLLEDGATYTLDARDSAYAMDGELGPISNPGTVPLVLIVVFVMPWVSAGAFESEESTAVPVDGS